MTYRLIYQGDASSPKLTQRLDYQHSPEHDKKSLAEVGFKFSVATPKLLIATTTRPGYCPLWVVIDEELLDG